MVYVKPPYPVDVELLYIVLVRPNVGPGGSPLDCLLRLLPAPVTRINNIDHTGKVAIENPDAINKQLQPFLLQIVAICNLHSSTA